MIPTSVEKIDSYAFCKCDKLTIYCEVKSRPNGWGLDSWNYSDCPVVWGY